jgi:transketolase
LRSAVAEVLIEECPVPLRSVGVKDHFGEVAKIDYLKKKYKMTAGDIVKAAKEAVALK